MATLETIEEIHVGDIGTELICTIRDKDGIVDSSTSTAKLILLEKPNGDYDIYAATFTTDGTDGKIQYTTTTASDLDQAGEWKIQARVQFPGGEWSSNDDEFTVHGNIDS